MEFMGVVESGVQAVRPRVRRPEFLGGRGGRFTAF